MPVRVLPAWLMYRIRTDTYIHAILITASKLKELSCLLLDTDRKDTKTGYAMP